MSVISVDFGAKGKHDSKSAGGALAEATRAPRPDGSSWAHGRFHHREWESQNKYWVNPDWDNDYDKAIATLRTKGLEKAIRSDAILLRSMIFQASPDFFFPKISKENWTPEMINDPRRNLDRGELDQEHVKAFYDHVLKYAQNTWGDRLLSVQLHVDEATPHAHIQIVPITADGRLCNKELINGRRASKAFVSEIAREIGKPIGLDRAREMTPEELAEHDGTHRSPDAIVTQLMDEERKQLDLLTEQNNTLRQSINDLRNVKNSIPEPFTRKQSDPEFKKNFFGQETEETEESYQRRVNEHDQITYDRTKWFSDNHRNIQTVLADHAKLSNELDERNKTVKRLENEIKQLKSERTTYRELAELTEQVRSIPLEKILLDNGFVYDRQESSVNHKQYRLSNGEMDRKICVSNGAVFIDNHDTAFCGRGPIDLMLCIQNGSVSKNPDHFKTAVSTLAEDYGFTAAVAAVSESAAVRKHPIVAAAIKTTSESIVSAVPRPVYTLPAHHPKKRPQALLWAIHRGITEKTVDVLLTTQQILLDRLGNIIVPRMNFGWFERGTYGAENKYKKTLGGKEGGPAILRGPECGENSDLIVCESVSDALALTQEFPAAEIAIIGGNLHPEIPRKPNQSVHLAFDNDQVGRMHYQHYMKAFPDAKPMFPPARNDWSDFVRDKAEIEAEKAKKFHAGNALHRSTDRADEDTTIRPGM